MLQFNIGKISKIVGLSDKTIRFYEDEGLITTPARSDNGYRLYSENNLEELKLLKQTRDLGLPITEVKKLMKGCENGDCEHSKQYIEKTISKYQDDLTKRIKQMKVLQTKLNQLKNNLTCDATNHYCCDILHQLINTKSGKEVKENVSM